MHICRIIYVAAKLSAKKKLSAKQSAAELLTMGEQL